MPIAQRVAAEPAEGFGSRWLARRARAIRRCRAEPKVRTWPQAVSCALDVAFPEAAPWVDPQIGDVWMQEAASLVESTLGSAVAAEYGEVVPQGWQAMLWLRGEREIRACSKAYVRSVVSLVACAAKRIYPQYRWPPGEPAEPWINDFWQSYLQIARGQT